MTQDDIAGALGLSEDDYEDANLETMEAYDKAWFHTSPGLKTYTRPSFGRERIYDEGAPYCFTAVRLMPDGTIERRVYALAEDVQVPDGEAAAAYLFDGGRFCIEHTPRLALPDLWPVAPVPASMVAATTDDNYENDIAHAEAALFHQAFGGTLAVDPAAQAECDAMHALAMSRAAKGLADLTVPEGRVMMAQELAEGITLPTMAEALAQRAAAWALADQAEQDLARVAPGKNNAGLDA